MTAMDAQQFEQRYRSDADPWRYRTSAYERLKYEATLGACGPGPFRSALELGGSIGVFSALLAPRCRSLTTVDFSPTAVNRAQRELAPFPHATAIHGQIPAAIPLDSFDLVVASEILYYLSADALAKTLACLATRVRTGGRLVCVHWRIPGPERPFEAKEVHERLLDQPWLEPVASEPTDDYLLDVLVHR